VGVAALGVQAAVARRLGGLLFRVADRELGLEEEAQGQRHALQEFRQQQALDPGAHGLHVVRTLRLMKKFRSRQADTAATVQAPKAASDMPDRITRPSTTSQMMVSGMKIFQPSRMIWS